jgi:hypothetical protein
VRLPRVSFWSVWNEPNQPGWLSPQYRVRSGGARSILAPALYREYVDAAWSALHATGHGGDRFLFGELAPGGCLPGGGGECALFAPAEKPTSPIAFVKALYCVNGRYRRLRGAAAAAVGCPAAGSAAAFLSAHPALFDAAAFTHHPYDFSAAPGISQPPGFVPIADLARLETALDRAFAAYGSSRRLPLYLDEYGYETDPPNPDRGVTLAQQASFIDQAAYLAWRDRRVEGLSQFLLVDSPPDAAAPKGTHAYWSTFQTGLEFLDGRPKPSYDAYRLPIWLPSPTVAPGGRLLVWAMLRAAANDTSQTAQVQWSAAATSGFRTLVRVTTDNPDGVFEARVAVPGSGLVRVQWKAPGQIYDSPADAVTVR